MSETVEVLKNIAKITSGGTPRKSNKTYWNGNIPWLSPKEMKEFRGTTEANVTTAAIGNGTRLSSAPAIFIAVRGMSLHSEIRIVYSENAITFNQDVKAIEVTDAYPKYVYYHLLGMQDYLLNAVESSGHGTGVLRTDVLSELKLNQPPLAEQKRIAHILGSFDDKIELNRQMNETLEAMAQALFKDWFVDFGPTRAKMAGKEPYLAPEIWDLFPDRLGEDGVPEGWGESTLGEIARSVGSPVDPGSVADDMPYIGLVHMPRNSLALTEWDVARSVTSGKTTFKERDILFGKLRPYFHKVGVAPVDGIASTDIVVLNTKNARYYSFVVALVSSTNFVEYTNLTSSGTKMPRTSWRTMSQYIVNTPNTNVIVAEFESRI